VTGPESTGKSQLAESLAAYFHTVWVPEYAREYLAALQRDYVYEDIALIARGQLMKEAEKALLARDFLFCDTELLVTKIWSEFKYQRCDPWISGQILTHTYDLYLLCDIDLPWEYDPLREHPDMRKVLFDLYKNELDQSGLPYGIVKGFGEARRQCALEIIRQHSLTV
jgi:NadR type nicotinamide-nucleotide adenylyltransferase